MDNNTLMDTTPQESVSQEQPALPDNKQTGNTTVDPWSEDIGKEDLNSLLGNEQTATESTDDNSDDKEADSAEPNNEDLDAIYKQQLESDAKLDKPIFIKYKGKVIDINDANELRDLAERGIVATYKLQEAAEIRKQYEGITPEDVELLRRFKAGDTSVIQDLAVERPQVDTTSEQINTIASEILSAPYAEQFKGFIDVLPPVDKQKLSSDPRILAGLKIDFDNGTAQKLMPLVERYVSINGMDFLSAYTKAGKEVLNKDSARKDSMEQLTAAPKSTTSVNKTAPTDVWSMSSEAFRKLGDNIRK
jgi:hypothetical protein